ncbi:MAG TPA: hypothetical protein VK167_14020 [Flavipsychrobacter sp.]|nr:hypothetical protein [Flavipsychrobacter sp.]
MKKILFFILSGALFITSCDKAADSAAPKTTSSSSTGQGGSLARFTTANDHMYIVDNQKLYTYSLLDEKHPQFKGANDVGFSIETIYAYKDKLFIGSSSAMYIYSISNPAMPTKLGQATHVRACDPVIANDSIAYVTVRGGTRCGGTQNALMVYDVKYITQPLLRKTVNMESPYGLGMKSNRLYVCNGSNGLNVYDITDPINPVLKKQLTGGTFYDVIIIDDLMIAMIEGGTALYELKANDEINLAAKITN